MISKFEALPQEVTIGISSIHGRGIFATSDIEEGHIFDISHVEDNSGNFHCNLIRTALGAFLNHSEENNAKIVKRGKYHVLIATEDIKDGTEITVNYNDHACGRQYVDKLDKECD